MASPPPPPHRPASVALPPSLPSSAPSSLPSSPPPSPPSEQQPSASAAVALRCCASSFARPQQAAKLSASVDKNDPLRLLKRYDERKTALYGSIKFTTSRVFPAKWACVSHTSSPDLIIKMFKGNAWKLSPPRVVISVTGAARFTDENQLSDRVEMQFRRGLRRAVLATNGWIVTGGTTNGVMGMVGRMVQELDETVAEEIVVLGVASWGAIAEHAEMDQMQPGKIFRYPDPEIVPTRGARLDPNHTHFLLVDDGSEWKYGAEIQLRAGLEQQLSRWSQETSGGIDAPKVLLVVGGGFGTLQTVLRQLQSKTPVVVIEESGGASRHLFLFWSRPEAQAAEIVRAELYRQTGQGEEACERYIEMLSKIVALGRKPQDANRSEQLSFFHGSNVQGSRNELDQVILRAILSDCERTVDAVMHAVLWGQPSIIRHQLQCSRDADPRGLGQAFEQALLAAQRTGKTDSRRVLGELIQFNVQPSHVRFDVLFENVKQSRRLDMLRGWRERVASIDSPRLRQKTFKKMPLANANALRKRLRPITRALVNQMEQKTARVTPGRGITSGDTEAGIMQMSEEFEFAGYKVFTRERLEAHRRACAVWTKACSTQAAQKNTAFPPEWIDLMMWAVSNSRTVLARPLFEKTEEPLRAALIACRYCQRRAQLAGHPQEKEEWSEQVGRWPVNRVIV
ncbi:MAG: hypothetical protein SGPRY_009812 [Prymnesium sp.]